MYFVYGYPLSFHRIKCRVYDGYWMSWHRRQKSTTTKKQVSQLTVFCLFACSIRYQAGQNLRNLLVTTAIPWKGAGKPFGEVISERFRNSAGGGCLGPEFHGDSQFWRWLAPEGLYVKGGSLSALRVGLHAAFCGIWRV